MNKEALIRDLHASHNGKQRAKDSLSGWWNVSHNCRVMLLFLFFILIVAMPTLASAVSYTVTPSSAGNGAINPSDPQTVVENETTSFTLVPDTGHHVTSVTGTCGGTLVGDTFTTNAITADCTVVANFSVTVTPSAGANGTIEPSTPQTIPYNETMSFTLLPGTGYHIESVTGTCGGTLVGDTYTTDAITANCTVVANFTINTYTVTPSAGANGTIEPSTPQTAHYNETMSFTLLPDTGYHIVSVTGTCGGTLVGNTYTTNAISANCTVIANFSIDRLTVTPSAGANGTIEPSTPQTVNYSDTISFTLLPDARYHIESVTGTCGGTLAGNTFTTNPITANCTVIANFSIDTYTVTPFVTGTGTIEPSTPQTVNYNTTTSFTLLPDARYHIESVTGTCGGTLVGNTYATNAITGNCTVIANFSIDSYTITASAGDNGSIAPSGTVSVPHGGSQYYSILPNAGHQVVEVLVDGSSVGAVSSYTFTNVTATHTISASFAVNPHTMWTSHGPEGGYIYSIAVSPAYATDSTIYTGTYGNGIYKSTNGGQSWIQINNGLTNLSVFSVAVSPNYAVDQTVFAGSDGGGIYISIDRGVSWDQVNSGLANAYVTSVAVSPNYAVDKTVFAGTNGGGVFQSTSGGQNWTQINTGLTNLYVFSVDISHAYAVDKTVFATTFGGGVYISEDSGVSWKQVNNGLTNTTVLPVAVSPDYATDKTVFAGTNGGGIYISIDRGVSWDQVNSGLTNAYVFSVSVSPHYKSDATVFAGTNGGGVFRSTDGGQNWTPLNSGLTNAYVFSVIVSPNFRNDATVFAGTYGGGVYKSVDGGLNWTQINSNFINTYVPSVIVSSSYTTDGTVFAGTWNGVSKSTNGGQNWTNKGLSDLNIFSVALSPDYGGGPGSTDRTVFAGTESGVYKSIDGGDNWGEASNGFTNPYVLTVAVSPAFSSDATVFAGTSGGGVFKSIDGGLNWTQAGDELTNPYVLTVAVSPAFSSDATVFAGTSGGGVFKSTNKGQSWSEMNKSLSNKYVTSIAVSPNFSSDSTVFAGTEGGIFKSTNRARSWTQVNTGLDNTYVFSVAYASNTTLFAGTEGGVFKSTNGGQSWIQVNNGLENKYVLSLSVSPAYTTDGTLFAGTNGGGVFNDPLLSTPVFKQWNMKIKEKSKISLTGHQLRINTDYYSEKWTLYENGLFGTDNNLYGTWQQKGGKVIMSFDPEGTGKNVSQVLKNKSHENAEEIIVSKLRLTIKEKKDGTFSGKYKETAKFRENGIKGKITIDRNFIGASDE